MITMKIAVVENEEFFISQMKEILEKWKADKQANCKIHIDTFQSGEAFLKSDLESYQIVFMDIQLDGKLNGIKTAHVLRNRKCEVPLVFLTSYSQYVLTGYEVRALYYIVKPVEYKKVAWCMDKVFEMEFQGAYIYKDKEMIHKISYKDILYFQSSLHYIDIFTLKRTFRQKLSLKKLKTLLPPQFVACHRTVIVNVLKIDYINGKELRMTDGSILPISNTYLENIRHAFLSMTTEEK